MHCQEKEDELIIYLTGHILDAIPDTELYSLCCETYK